MKRVNALEMRQSLGKVLATLLRTGEPIIVEKARKPVAALITLQDFQERFVEKDAVEARERILKQMDEIAVASVDKTSVVDVLRDLRGNA